VAHLMRAAPMEPRSIQQAVECLSDVRFTELRSRVGREDAFGQRAIGVSRGTCETAARCSPSRYFTDFRFLAVLLAFRLTCSGNRLLPVSRFHSSNVSGEIFPSTRS
jgi:hypothetical protein